MSNEPLHLDVIEYLDDKSLLEKYQKTDEVPGDALTDDLLAEIKRRHLDI